MTAKTSMVLVAITLASTPLLLRGDDAKQQLVGAEQIDLAELPDPPAELEKLIDEGDVSFFVGQRAADAQSRSPNRGGTKLSAETHYHLGFDYRCRSRWRIANANGKRILSITVAYQQIKLNRSHEIWLRNRPKSSTFWSSKLVLHEFDHVRLSSDPTIERHFVESLRKDKTITEEIAANVRVTETFVRAAIDRHAKEIFDETIALINIRYQELDRQTDHGLQPLPDDSSLAEWLR